ncbi:MAG: periplasmic heavy metal sensor, partial [Gammaproteobacteria bacterium]
VAEPLDNAAISAAFADLRDASQHYQTLSHQQTVAVMQQLTAEERQAALEFIRRGGPRGNGGSRRPGMPPTPDPNGPPRQ